MAGTGYNVGKFALLAIIVSLVAALGAVKAGFPNTAAVALMTTAIVAGLVAGISQWRKTGGIPGPAISLGTISHFVLLALFLTYSDFAGAMTPYALISWAIGFLVILEEEIAGIPISQPPQPPATAVPLVSNSTSNATTSTTNSGSALTIST